MLLRVAYVSVRTRVFLVFWERVYDDEPPLFSRQFSSLCEEYTTTPFHYPNQQNLT